MPDQRPDIWFVRGGDDSGAYTPVTRQGCLVFVAAALWIILCGIGGMAGFLYAPSPLWFLGMFAAGVPGLILMARTIRRHS